MAQDYQASYNYYIMSSEPKPTIITQEECYQTFKRLSLGASSKSKRSKSSKDEVFTIVEDILSEFKIKILAIPDDENGANEWKIEQKRLWASFLRMKGKIASRKFSGSFFDSSNYSFYATLQETDSNLSDPTFQVSLLYHSIDR